MQKEKLVFNYFPSYAKFLLKYKLEELVREQLLVSRQISPTVLNLTIHNKEEEVIKQLLQSTSEFLTIVSENRLSEYISDTIQIWKRDEIYLFRRKQFTMEDITLDNYLRRKAYTKFLPFYTSDVRIFSKVLDEIDLFIMEVNTQSFKTYVKIQEEETHKNLHLIKEITNLTPSIIGVYNVHSGKYLFINEALQKQLGYNRQEGASEDLSFFLEICHPDDFERIQSENAQALERANQKNSENSDVQEFSYRLRHKNGEYHWYRTYATVFDRNEENKVEHVLNISVDITKEMFLQKQLEEEKAFAEMLIENSPEMIVAYDKDFRITAWNKQSEIRSGIKKEFILGKKFYDLAPYNQNESWINRMKETLSQALMGKEFYLHNQKYIHGEGYCDGFIGPIYNTKNEIFGILSITHDITELVNKTNKLNELNKELESNNRELASFNYVASHDLQEPLRKINIFTDLLMEREYENLSENGQKNFERIHSSVKGMQRLLGDLLEFSRTHSTSKHFEPIDLNIILSEVKATMKEKLDKENVIISECELPVIKGISFQLRQLFINIIGNAIKYKKPYVHPLIVITSEVVPAFTISDLRPSKKEYIQISFSDNGIGFHQKYADKIFEVFQRLHTKEEYAGSGIGLAICKKITENHEGFIRAYSKPSQGATFQIFFPVN